MAKKCLKVFCTFFKKNKKGWKLTSFLKLFHTILRFHSMHLHQPNHCMSISQPHSALSSQIYDRHHSKLCKFEEHSKSIWQCFRFSFWSSAHFSMTKMQPILPVENCRLSCKIHRIIAVEMRSVHLLMS